MRMRVGPRGACSWVKFVLAACDASQVPLAATSSVRCPQASRPVAAMQRRGG